MRHPTLSLLAVFALFSGSIVLAGCGGTSADNSATATPRTPAVPSSTATGFSTLATSVPFSTPTPVSVATSTPAPRPTPTKTVSPTSLAVTSPTLVSASLGPAAPAVGGRLYASVVTRGSIARVEVYVGSGAPNAPAPRTYQLTESSLGRWVGGGAAPTAAGVYHYSVGLFSRSGRRTIVDRDAWSITIGGGAPTAIPAVQAFPDDIPLVPPFSYGSPVPAIFNAEGRTVNGAEVSSTVRSDVPAATVSQWYGIHFPRAGWSVDQSTVPAPSATAFSIVATKGNRVCIAQYDGAAVHLFYGTLS